MEFGLITDVPDQLPAVEFEEPVKQRDSVITWNVPGESDSEGEGDGVSNGPPPPTIIRSTPLACAFTQEKWDTGDMADASPPPPQKFESYKDLMTV